MIPGKRIALQKAVERELNTRRERVAYHLFPEEAGYAKHLDGAWHVWPPGGRSLRLDPAVYTATEHADGTATIEGPAFVTAMGAWKLVAGNWEPAAG